MFKLILPTILLSLATTASAQTPQAQQQALATLAAVGQHVSTDVARVDGGTLLYVGGWAFECSSASQAITDVLIDGAPTGILLYSAPRGDVSAWATTYGVCDFNHTPYYSGLNGWASVSDLHLASGPHSAQLRIRNANGVQTLGAPVAFIVP